MSGGCFGSDDKSVTPKPDNTPVGHIVQPCADRNFVIILGGPGKFSSSDKDHDQYWGNYFVAAQHVFGMPGSAKASQFTPDTSLLSGECVHWLVYEKPYNDRWTSDKNSSITFLKEAASQYPSGYLARVKEYIGELNKAHGPGRHKYVAIDSYSDVWETLHKLPDGTLTRMHYFGHGVPSAFCMRWAQAEPPTAQEMVGHDKIDDYASWLKIKAKPADNQISKFYACSSLTWAKKWNATTGLKSQGATSKITFVNIRTSSTLRSLESDGSPGWTSF